VPFDTPFHGGTPSQNKNTLKNREKSDLFSKT
jgi:hypothetical protein